jgi:hypothetical protein
MAIGVCRTYVQAQREYAAEDRDGSGMFKYRPAHQEHEGNEGRPLLAGGGRGGAEPARASRRRDPRRRATRARPPRAGAQPFHGYLFKILSAQGPARRQGGAFDYVINGNMIAGFALVAYPAHWGESGVMTFIVNQWGKVYERNLGEDSAQIAASAMTEFNPDGDWAAVEAP